MRSGFDSIARLLLVFLGAGWLLYAFHCFFGAPFPERGVIICLPQDGELHFEQGVVRGVTGRFSAIDYGPWWLISLYASVGVLLLFALRGCFSGRASGDAPRT